MTMPDKEPLKRVKPFWGTKGLLIGIILCLGAGWPVMKVSLSVVSPLWMAFFRILITFLVVLVVAGIQKKIRIPKTITNANMLVVIKLLYKIMLWLLSEMYIKYVLLESISIKNPKSVISDQKNVQCVNLFIKSSALFLAH